MKNKKKFIDPLIKRKKEISNNVQYFNNIPIPSIIEISESERFLQFTQKIIS